MRNKAIVGVEVQPSRERHVGASKCTEAIASLIHLAAALLSRSAKTALTRWNG
mgnify:CR=1 FL=1